MCDLKDARERIERELQATMSEISRHRDRLRDLVDTAKEILYDCDEAIDNIDRAADAISRRL